MNRGRALKVVLVLVGLLFAAGALPMLIMVSNVLQPHGQHALPNVLNTANEAMILSLYVTLGIFLLLAARDPSAHRSVIAFAAWSSFAHAAVMAVMGHQGFSRTRRVADHRSCAQHHGRASNRLGSGKAGRSTGCRCLSHGARPL
jgi:hypothetical protein